MKICVYNFQNQCNKKLVFTCRFDFELDFVTQKYVEEGHNFFI